LYQNAPDGISGNEDCGQMSAWYVFSSLGFYPVTPGSNEYIIGTPLFPKGTINLENGKQFTIVANKVSSINKYIEYVYLNGKKLERTYLRHNEIIQGGTLEFHMTDNPAIWGSREGQEPITAIKEHVIVSAPFIAKGDVAFKGETEVVLDNVDKNTSIYYRIGEKGDFKTYENPFIIDKAISLYVYSKKDEQQSATIETSFYKIDPNISITLDTEYANQYNAGGNDALIDGIKGARDFRTGTWQGYFDEDVIATVDLGSEKPINLVTVSFLRDQRSWIFLPTEVEILGSNNGTTFKSLGNQTLDTSTNTEEVIIKTLEFKQSKTNYRYVKLIAKKLGQLPEWHLGYKHDGRSWIFVDEISIQ
jgi:hypothetical protein